MVHSSRRVVSDTTCMTTAGDPPAGMLSIANGAMMPGIPRAVYLVPGIRYVRNEKYWFLTSTTNNLLKYVTKFGYIILKLHSRLPPPHTWYVSICAYWRGWGGRYRSSGFWLTPGYSWPVEVVRVLVITPGYSSPCTSRINNCNPFRRNNYLEPVRGYFGSGQKRERYCCMLFWSGQPEGQKTCGIK